jgi:putative mRNA 3-end processing factor
MLVHTEAGLYCPDGDFYIDPWLPVPRAVITHAHADHLRWGCGAYLVSREGEAVSMARLGTSAPAVQSVSYGETVVMQGVRVSLHPAGHILGSAQVRVEHGGQVWVVTGDYKTEADATCTPFELVRCHTFITESTFGLPIYRWEPQQALFDAINSWWRANRDAGRASIIYGYALGKAQRILAGVDAAIGGIYTHGAVERLVRVYRQAGVTLPHTTHASALERNKAAGALIVAPPSAHGTPWLRRFGDISTAFASGWMTIRGARRRRAVDRGFALSDHVDWVSLTRVIRETGAESVWVTHGYTAVVVRWLLERGIDARVLNTRYQGEISEADEEDAALADGVEGDT